MSEVVSIRPFGHYSVRRRGEPGTLRLLCGSCAESRRTFGELVRFVDPIHETDRHTDCADCGLEWIPEGPGL